MHLLSVLNRKEETVMKRILVIEDEALVRENIIEILEFMDYEVDGAVNGKDGVIQAMYYKPDLIVCDVMMPELDGFEVIKLVRQNKEIGNVPFIFLTARAERRDMRLGMNLGADDYLPKPFTAEELIAAIETRLQRNEQMQYEIKEQVQHINQQISTNAAHEMNTPLNAVLGFAELLVNRFELC